MKIIHHKRVSICQFKEILFIKNFRRNLIKVGVYLILLSIAILIALIPNINTMNHVTRPNTRFTTDLKYILFWKQPKKHKRNFFSKDVEYLPGQGQFIQQNCPYINCYITYNRSLLRDEEDFDAVVFNVHNIKKLNTYNINLGRSAKQIYIFKAFESAENHPVCNPMLDDFFNWTWTYKLNSDVSQPFFNIYDTQNNIVGPGDVAWAKDMTNTDKFKSKIADKVKAVAWLVTNCKLKHKNRDFIKELRNELRGYNYSIDLYGPCSENKCPKGGLVKCYKTIDKKYYFNLVLEDSIAEDYVTEKMVKAMTHLSVPIVYGGANYSKFLPPGSYINARAFDLKKLGAILDYLIRNPKKYAYFFDWKKYYYYAARPKTFICDLCTKLNQNGLARKSYRELRRWWNPDFEEACQRIHMYTLFRDTP